MKGRTLAGLLSLTVLGAGAAEAPPPVKAPDATPSLRARLTDDVVKQAVRETLADSPREPKSAPSGQALSGERYQTFSREFTEAQKPSCLGPNALKFQPAGFSTKNWNFGVGGVFALPFWAAAIVRGKCQ